MPVPQAGQIWGNYQLKRFIAKGGFGWVFAAQHKWLKTPVAIKILDTNPYRLQKDIEQFLAEAQKLQALRHPNIVKVKDFGIAHDMPYLVMPLYKASLSSLRGRILPLPTIIAYVKQIASALDYVHQHQIVHRDIKPENFLLGNTGEVILSDFGIATLTHSITTGQGGAGTAPYMPPEQWKAEAVRASDQYALAIVVYQWLCGELPFQGTALEIMGQHINVQPPSLQQKNPVIEESIEAVVMKALAKEPTQRFGSIVEFAEALEKAAKPFSLELLLVFPIPERETIMFAEWVWGNHYLFLLYEDKRDDDRTSHIKIQMVDVLSGETILLSEYQHYVFNEEYPAVFWDRENCTINFPDGVVSFIGGPHFPRLIDSRTGKTIASFQDDAIVLGDLNAKYEGLGAFSQSLEGKKIIALASSLIKSDRGWYNRDANDLPLSIDNYFRNTISIEFAECKISFCPPHWQFVAIARKDKHKRIEQIEIYRVVRHSSVIP